MCPIREPSVMVVLVHFGNLADTVECLSSLAKVEYDRLHVIVVNNGSGDFDDTRVRQAFPSVTVLRSAHNLGFAGGNNLGISRALEDSADLILLLNNDTVVRADLIKAMLPVMRRPDVGIAGPVITYYDAPDKVWYAGGAYSRLLGYSYKARPLVCSGADRPVDFVNGCALMVKREVFETIGLLREDFFLYFEEVEFCLRATHTLCPGSLQSYRCMLVGKPLVQHKVSASSGIRGTDQLRPDKAYYFGRNPFLLMRSWRAEDGGWTMENGRRRTEEGRGKVANWLWVVTGTLSQFLVVLPFWAMQSLAVRNTRVLGAYLAGMWDGICGRSGKRVMGNGG